MLNGWWLWTRSKPPPANTSRPLASGDRNGYPIRDHITLGRRTTRPSSSSYPGRRGAKITTSCPRCSSESRSVLMAVTTPLMNGSYPSVKKATFTGLRPF
jgi:hypothetical protein